MKQDAREQFLELALHGLGTAPDALSAMTYIGSVGGRTRGAGAPGGGEPMRVEAFSFGSIQIDGLTHTHDVVIDRGRVRKRSKKPSKKYRDAYGHTPVSLAEDIPWKCRRLVIGTGTGALPVMEEVKREARRRHVKLVILPTAEAIAELAEHGEDTNAILHVTC
jgi:hypothetical protein